MSEWSKEPDSKSGVGLVLTVGSNPTHSAFYCFEETRLLTAASFVFFGIALGWFSSFLRFFALTEENFLPKFVFSNLLKKTLDVSMVLKNDFLDLLHVHRLLKSVLQCHATPTKAPNSHSFRTIAQFMSKTTQNIAKPQGPTVKKQQS